MENEQNSFKLVVLVAAVLALLFVAFLVTKKFANRSSEQQSAQQKPAVVEKTNVDFSKNPEKFPTDIPVEAGARITQNYNAVTPQGMFQATKVFETKDSLSSKLALYTKYFNDNGWSITATVDQETFKMVSAQKDGQTIQVSIDQNKVTNIRTVSINYSEKL